MPHWASLLILVHHDIFVTTFMSYKTKLEIRFMHTLFKQHNRFMAGLKEEN